MNRRAPSRHWMFRTQREPLLVSVLLLVVFTSIALYILWALQGVSAARERNILRRSSVLASLYSKVIHKDVNDSEKVLTSLVDRFFSQSVHPTMDAQRQIAEYCDISPRISGLSVIDPSGKCLYSTSDRCAEFKQYLNNFRHRDKDNIGYLPAIENLRNQMTFFTPIPKRGPPQGYVISSFRPEGFSFWLMDFQITGTQALIVRRDGSVLVSTTNDQRIRRLPVNYLPLLLVRQGESGAVRATGAFGEQKDVFVGFCPIPETEWYLMVIQNARDAFQEEDYPVLSLTRVAAPFLFLIPLIAWSTLNLYHRQVRKAQLLVFANEKLHLADQAKSDLLANVSHDLKTPLASLQLSLGSLRREVLSSDQEHLRKTVLLLEQELERLHGKVRNLLDLSRLESASQADTLYPCDLYEIVAEALERLQPLLQGRSVEASFPEEALLVAGAAEQLVSVVVNLLENACKYAPLGTPLHLWGERSQGKVCLSVRDFGPGVPESQEERVFEKFYRVPGQKAHGTGLGLALCRAIVRAHHGTITVQKAPGGGALFRVELPELTEEREA